jgi:phage-related protein
VLLLHAVKKKTQEMKARDIDTAESRMNEFEERIRTGEIKL